MADRSSIDTNLVSLGVNNYDIFDRFIIYIRIFLFHNYLRDQAKLGFLD